jgi:hypothetical protein
MSAPYDRRPHQRNYEDRRKDKGVLRMNLVLDTDDQAALGRIMKRNSCTRMEAVRIAIRNTLA